MKAMDGLRTIQGKLNAPKGQENKFGGYRYRSLEDICAAVKPLLIETETAFVMSDDIVQIGERIYVRAMATLHGDEDTQVSATGWAREPASRKGMDDAQVTGATSSYARKYAANALFAIDDTKDADSMAPPEHTAKKPALKTQPPAQGHPTTLQGWKDEAATKKTDVDLKVWRSGIGNQVKATLNPAEQKQLLDHLNEYQKKLEAGPTVDCPENPGAYVPKSYCSECTKREGCPAVMA